MSLNWTEEGGQHAFLYDGSTMLDLCILADCLTAGWTGLGQAWDINDNGDIVGYGSTPVVK